MVMVRAAMVVFDFFPGVPTTMRQSPTATALSVSVAVSLKVVVVVQLTAVCAVVLCTSMVVPEMLATLPVAPIPRGGAGGARPTADSPRRGDAQTRASPAAIPARPSPRELRDVIVIVFVLSLFGLSSTHSSERQWGPDGRRGWPGRRR